MSKGEYVLPPGCEEGRAIEHDFYEVDGDEVKFFATYQVGGWNEDEGYYGIVIDDGPASGERWYW